MLLHPTWNWESKCPKDSDSTQTVTGRLFELARTTAEQIGDLVLLSAFECIDLFGKGRDGRVNLPRKELKIERLAQIENAEKRSESRPNALGTNGATSILVETVQVPDPGDNIRKRWIEVSSLPSVSKLLATLKKCGPGPSVSTNITPPKGLSYPESYCAIILSDAIVRLESGKELTRWSCATGERLLHAMTNQKHLSTIVAPLVNFLAETEEPIVVTDQVRIRPATEDEVEEFGIRTSIFGVGLSGISGFVRFRPVRWVAETSYTFPPDDGTAQLLVIA
jgi:hypothetical protein